MLTYVRGNVLDSPVKTLQLPFIPHVVNDIPVAKAGFVNSIKAKHCNWHHRYVSYAKLINKSKFTLLGKTHFFYPEKLRNVEEVSEKYGIEFTDERMIPNKFRLDAHTQPEIICDMFAQSGIRNQYNTRPLKYEHLITCMKSVRQMIQTVQLEHGRDCCIFCPKFGSGLAGGKWSFIEELIDELWLSADIDVYVHTF